MRQLRVKGIKKLILFLSLLVTCYLLLVTAAYADEISSRAAIVIDGTNERILYAKNPNLKLLPASTTKLVTAMVALDRINPDTVVTVSKRAANTYSVSPALEAGKRYSVKDLLYLALMRSVNGATVALAEAAAGSEGAFVVMMNEKMQQLGAENTRFVNSSGLPGAGQHITVYDLSSVMKESLKYPLIREIINTRIRDVVTPDKRHFFIKNTNELLWADESILGGKTGFTRAAGHCFVCAVQKGENLIIAAVLGVAGRNNLWHETTAILARGYDVISGRAEPITYFSSVRDNPVVLASFKDKKINGHRDVVKKKKNSNPRKINTDSKKGKTKRYVSVGRIEG